jgi:tetratricopeptide (TPR) repeat protein
MTDILKRNIFLTIIAVFGVLIVGSGAVLTGAIDPSAWFRELNATKHPVEDTDLLYANATLRFQDNDNLSAGTLARRILILNPNDVRARKLLAAVALRQKDYETAEKQCAEALRIDPTDMTARIGLGTAQRERGKMVEAAATFKGIKDDSTIGQHRDEANLHLLEMERELRELATKNDKQAEKTLANVNTILHSDSDRMPPSRSSLLGAPRLPSPTPSPLTGPGEPALDLPATDLLAPPSVSAPRSPSPEAGSEAGTPGMLPGVRP